MARRVLPHTPSTHIPEMAKAGIIDEMMSDAMDSVMDSDDLEEETEEQVGPGPGWVGGGGGQRAKRRARARVRACVGAAGEVQGGQRPGCRCVRSSAPAWLSCIAQVRGGSS